MSATVVTSGLPPDTCKIVGTTEWERKSPQEKDLVYKQVDVAFGSLSDVLKTGNGKPMKMRDFLNADEIALLEDNLKWVKEMAEKNKINNQPKLPKNVLIVTKNEEQSIKARKMGFKSQPWPYSTRDAAIQTKLIEGAKRAGQTVVFSFGGRSDIVEQFYKVGCPVRSIEKLPETATDLNQQILLAEEFKIEMPPAWRSTFLKRSELDSSPVQYYIDDFLPEGITFFGGLSGSGKSWLALSIAKALTSGNKFVGVKSVLEPQNVLYLAPESGERSLNQRLTVLDMPEDRFYCTTVNSAGLKLNDPVLLSAIDDLKPVVFLDTAIRFLNGADENSSSQTSNALADAVFALQRAGAKAIVGIHHSPKSSATADSLTLENALRGTGDIGAMCDAVYAVKCVDYENLVIKVINVKNRDKEKIPSFMVQGRPYLDDKHDLVMLDTKSKLFGDISERDRLDQAIEANPSASIRDLQNKTGINKNRIKDVAAEAGWYQTDSVWIKSDALLKD